MEPEYDIRSPLDDFSAFIVSTHMAASREVLMEAAEFAAKAHAGVMHRRKYTGEPYIHHPIEVAKMLALAGGNVEEVMAALMHDVVEDTPTTRHDIASRFGARVAALVSEVSDVSVAADGSRETRKAIDREHLARASASGHSIKLADLISNTRSITRHDARFARVYLREKAELLKVLTRGDAGLMVAAQKALEDGLATLNGVFAERT